VKLFRAVSFFAGALSCAALAQNFDTGLRAYEQHDYKTAMQEWRPLADKGNDMAEFNLGLMYYDGKGVTQDYAAAAQWFERAANQGYIKAQHNLGEMYAIGQGVKKDYVQSYKWLSICAAGGNQTCADHRDWVAKKLNGSKLSAAQRLAKEWKPVKAGS
jgi:TPR repeat protein